MVIDSKYTKSFISDRLSDTKYMELYSHAILLNNHKNLISIGVCNNLSLYMDMNMFDFLKHMRSKYKGVINSNFDKQLYQDVFIAYQNKFEATQKSIIFEKITFKGFEFYKRNTKNSKTGDFKKVIIKKEKTPLSNCLTYLARYGNENTVEYINNQLKINNLTIDKINYYNDILRCISKFGFDRLFLLATQRRNRIIKKYSEHSIEFKSLTFRGRSRLHQDIISFNEHFNSIISSFINISWLGRGNKLSIPVKYSKDYHGLMSEYHKPTPDIEYLITFIHKGKIKINICKDGERTIPENKVEYVGIDANVKHNLFTLSDGKSFDYNRELLNQLTKELSKIDNLKMKNNTYIVGRKKQRKIDSMRNKIQKQNENICSDICKYLNSTGLDHIVMENLDNSFGKCFINDKNNNDLNFNRITKELKLSSLKQMMEHIGKKYNISLSTVHPEYTSKMCPICWCIEDENRPDQETFKCIDCNHKDNADINAAINIKNRVASTVLRSNLLKQSKLDNGTYEPKILKREKVKEILLSFRQNLVIDRDVLKMNSFEYV